MRETQTDSPYSYNVVFFLSIPPSGLFGVHRLYSGQPLTGFAMMALSIACLIFYAEVYEPHYQLEALALIPPFVWSIYDLVAVSRGKFYDGKKRLVIPSPTE